MPAVAIIADVIISDVVGTGIIDAVASVTGSMLIGDIASGAVIGAVGGGLSAAVQGGNIWQGIEMGALGGGVSAGITGALQGQGFGDVQGAVDSSGNPVLDQFGNQVQIQGAGGVTLPESLQPGTSNFGKALTGALSSAGGALATGKGLKTALETGAITGVADFLLPGSPNASGTDKALTGIERGFLSTGLSEALLSPSSTPVSESSRSPTVMGRALGGVGVGSQALSQALNVGDGGGPIFGSGEGGKKKNVWNVGSLRYMGSPESENG